RISRLAARMDEERSLGVGEVVDRPQARGVPILERRGLVAPVHLAAIDAVVVATARYPDVEIAAQPAAARERTVPQASLVRLAPFPSRRIVAVAVAQFGQRFL